MPNVPKTQNVKFMQNSTLDDISAVVGFTATVALAARYGGKNLHIPLQTSGEHPIAKLAGISVMERLVQNWGGKSLAIPTLNCVEISLRNERVTQMLQAKTPHKTIAKMTGLSLRRITQLKAQHDNNHAT